MSVNSSSDDSQAVQRDSIGRIRRCLHSALVDNNPSDLLALTEDDAVEALDEMWKLFELPVLLQNTIGTQSSSFRNQLRRVSLKLVQASGHLPSTFVLKGVQCSNPEPCGVGAFADVFRGTSHDTPVALKRLRVFISMPESDRQQKKQQFYREAFLWKAFAHKHVLSLLGVSEDVFGGSICMVLPWMENGNIRQYIKNLQAQGKLIGDDFVESVDNWLYQIDLGLEYLHTEGIVHGDLHGGNILVDADGNIRLTDFGMSLITDATAYNYASIHGGGAIRWTAPELIDAARFGVTSSRPTPTSDVYAFGCLCIELYTGKPPFAELPESQVLYRILEGRRPARPKFQDGGGMSILMWSLTSSCLSTMLSARPSSQALAVKLRDFLEKWTGQQLSDTFYDRFTRGSFDTASSIDISRVNLSDGEGSTESVVQGENIIMSPPIGWLGGWDGPRLKSSLPGDSPVPGPNVRQSRTELRDHTPIPIYGAPPSPSHLPYDVLPDNWIPYANDTRDIMVPPPHELSRPVGDGLAAVRSPPPPRTIHHYPSDHHLILPYSINTESTERRKADKTTWNLKKRLLSLFSNRSTSR